MAVVLSLACAQPAAAADWTPPKLRLDWKQLRQIELEVQPYVDLVDRYGRGDRAAAVAEIASWPTARLKEQLQPFMGLAKYVPYWDPAGNRVRVALMLHADAALLLRENRLRTTLQDDAARSLAREFAAHPQLSRFIRRWFIAIACDAQARLFWLDALAWADRGLRSYDDDVELRLVVASVEEVLASRTASPVPDAVFDGSLDARGAALPPPAGVSRDHLERARRALLSAAQRDPARSDVQLRLGRVQWRLGRLADARRTLEGLLAARPREQAYLAHLFYGQLLEDEGALEAAAREYSLAVALDPRCQAARLALSHAGLELGESSEARADVELALDAAGARPAPDPFWQYHWGPSVRYAGLLAELRREASR